MNKLVLDTAVVVAARRSPTGASNELLRRVGRGEVRALASVPMFYEYEAVMKRPEQLAAMNMTTEAVDRFLDAFARLVVPVTVHYLWRPSLADPADELFLEAAVNGRAGAIATFNRRDFRAAERFGMPVMTPAELLRRMQ